METIRWGMIGCGDVAEVKSGPALYKAEGSSLVAVTRRDRAKADDYARRHNVPRVHATADELICDPDVDAVYIATPPSLAAHGCHAPSSSTIPGPEQPWPPLMRLGGVLHEYQHAA